MNPPRRPIHIERTHDPAVLRWVLHHPALAAASPGRRRVPPDGALGRLFAEKLITDVTIRNGDALVRTTQPAHWPVLAAEVQAALLVALDQLDQGTATWLLDADTDAGLASDGPSILELQAIVDRTARAAMAAHGGTLTVTAVDGSTAHLRADGACHGCDRSDETLLRLIGPAIRASYPGIVAVVLDPEPDPRPARAPTIRRVLAPRRIPRLGEGPACH